MRKKVLFLTGTRADYGKMKSLMKALDNSSEFEVFVFVCGMHLLSTFGSTYEEVLKDAYENVYVAYGLAPINNSSIDLGNTISYLSGYVENIKPDFIVVHGDRMDALAGAIVGALHNTLVGHIEGGELSGTIDESTRHAISKFAHIHFVCTEEAKNRLIQLGEESERIFVIGSPDIDIMVSDNLPSFMSVKEKYDIPFDDFAILMYHPVTTENALIREHIKKVVDAVIDSKKNYIVVYPNNDLGSEIILSEYGRLADNNRFKIFPSVRFEYFLTMLKNCEFIIGNSSAGIRESGVYGIPAIDIGTRQSGRYSMQKNGNVQHVRENEEEILKAINNVEAFHTVTRVFGNGNSTQMFYDILCGEQVWSINIQKKFIDCDF